MEYWIIYHVASGEPVIRGSGSLGTAAFQQLPEGCDIVVVPQKVIAAPEIDLDALRESLSLAVDNAAERQRAFYITALPGQVGAYLQKEAAARRWLADDSAPVRMLQPEAAARGMTVEALAEEVVGRAEEWERLSGAIEGVRFDAKTRIATATTFGHIVAASALDWSVLHAA